MRNSLQVQKKLGYKCNLKNPITFNEKINWLKLHDRNPIYPIITDKIRAKKIAEHGICKFIFTFDNRFSGTGVRSNCYTPEWDRIPLVWGRRANTEYLIEKPANLDEMLEIATKLATFLNNPFIRVDLYSLKEKVYFGEYTLYPGGGLHTFEPFKWDVLFGEQLHIASD